jgi:hypothetical protein
VSWFFFFFYFFHSGFSLSGHHLIISRWKGLVVMARAAVDTDEGLSAKAAALLAELDKQDVEDWELFAELPDTKVFRRTRPGTSLHEYKVLSSPQKEGARPRIEAGRRA